MLLELLSPNMRAVTVLFGLQLFYLFIFKHEMDVQFDDIRKHHEDIATECAPVGTTYTAEILEI